MSYGGVRPGGLMQSTALHEKSEMQGLNDRLAGYIQRMRNLKQDGPSLDPAKYHEAMRLLEDELMKLKNLYEAELDRLRRLLEDANRQKNQLANNSNMNQSALGDLQSKLSNEANRARKATDDLNNLQRALAQKEKDLADLRALLKSRDMELDHLRPEYKRLINENEDLKRQLGNELGRRSTAEEQAKKMADKLNFDGQVNNQQLKDLQDRLKTANDIIMNLERKLKQLGQDTGQDLARILQRLRDGTNEELRKYQRETEDALNKSMQGLKCQMDRDAQDKARLARENDQLKEALQRANQRIADLEGQLTGLKQQLGAMQQAMDGEKARANAQIRDLENKSRDLQGQVMNQVKDFNTARDAQASLRAEIDNYRNLLDAEDHRTAQRAGAMSRCSDVPQTFSPQPPVMDQSMTSRGHVPVQPVQPYRPPSAMRGRTPVPEPPSYGTHQQHQPYGQKPNGLPYISGSGSGQSGYTKSQVNFGPTTVQHSYVGPSGTHNTTYNTSYNRRVFSY